MQALHLLAIQMQTYIFVFHSRSFACFIIWNWWRENDRIYSHTQTHMQARTHACKQTTPLNVTKWDRETKSFYWCYFGVTLGESSGIPNIYVYRAYNTNQICWANRFSLSPSFTCMFDERVVHTRMPATKCDYIWISKDFSVADCSCRFRGKIGLFSFVKFRFFVLNLVFFGVSFGVCLLRAIHIHHHVEFATICAICYSLFSREFACEQKRQQQQQQKSNHVCRCMNARCVNCECKICSRTTLSLLVLRRYAVMLLHAHSLIHSFTHFVSVNRILSMAYNFDMFFIYSFESRWYAYLSVDFFRIRIFFWIETSVFVEWNM